MLELIIAMAVLAVLSGLAAPGFSQLMAGSRLQEQHRALASTLRLSRAQARQRRQRVVVCARASDTACGTDWTQGWIVFVDERTGTVNALDSAETVLRRQPPAPTRNLSIVARQRAPWATQTLDTVVIAIEPGARGATVLVTICDGRGAAHALPVVMEPSGAIRTTLGHDGTGARLDPWSDPVVCPA